MKHFRLFYKFPRIDHFHSRALKIFDVTSDHSEAMRQRGRGDQTINFRQLPLRTQSAPNLSFIKTDPKNPPLENRHNFRERFIKYSSLYWILGPDLFDSFADLPHRQDTQVMRLCSMILEPSTHGWIRSAAFSSLGNHVGIDEEHAKCTQSSAKPWSLRGGLAWRGSFRSKSQSSVSSASPVPKMSSRLLIFDSFAFLSASAMAAAKIRLCSSSAETPCAAARSFSAFTSVSGIFLTNNWAMQ